MRLPVQWRHMHTQTADRIRAEMRNGYAGAAAEASQTRERLYGEELKRFVDYVREKEAVLEVGCGDGWAFAIFRGKHVAYTGVDVSPEAVERARARWKDEAVFEAGDILDLPTVSGRFDAVLALGILHHIPSAAYRLKAMTELARAARPGGYVMIANWNLWQPRYWRVLLHQRFGLRNGWDFGDLKIGWRKPDVPRFYHVFTAKEMRRLCEGARLDVVEQYYVRDGEISDWRRGRNLVTIARKR